MASCPARRVLHLFLFGSSLRRANPTALIKLLHGFLCYPNLLALSAGFVYWCTIIMKKGIRTKIVNTPLPSLSDLEAELKSNLKKLNLKKGKSPRTGLIKRNAPERDIYGNLCGPYVGKKRKKTDKVLPSCSAINLPEPNILLHDESSKTHLNQSDEMAGRVEERLTYSDKVILAPMVRIGTLPSRLLALDYGADIVYSEEIIDHKLLQCKRVENDLLGTVDYVLICGTVVFRTCSKEKGRVVLQMGTSDPDRALRVAKLVEKDVGGIDVNMGCPKEFSVKGGMGAALLTQPEKVKKILTTLVQGVSIPVTCKIRILPELEDTLKLVKLIESTGVAALAVHGRLKEERPRHSNNDEAIRAIVDHVKIPVIANGGSKDTIREYNDIAVFRQSTNASSVMIARAAQWNTSVFRKEGLLPVMDVIKAYLKYCIDFSSVPGNVKYNIQQFMHEMMETELGRKLYPAITMAQICDIFEMSDYLHQVESERQTKKRLLAKVTQEVDGVPKKRKLDDGSEIIELPVWLHKKHIKKGTSPKLILHSYTRDHSLTPPTYDTTCRSPDRFHISTVSVDGKKYATTLWNSSKKWAEQAAAAVCLRTLGLEDGVNQAQLSNKSPPIPSYQEMELPITNCEKTVIPNSKEESVHCESVKTVLEKTSSGSLIDDTGAKNGCAETDKGNMKVDPS